MKSTILILLLLSLNAHAADSTIKDTSNNPPSRLNHYIGAALTFYGLSTGVVGALVTGTTKTPEARLNDSHEIRNLIIKNEDFSKNSLAYLRAQLEETENTYDKFPKGETRHVLYQRAQRLKSAIKHVESAGKSASALATLYKAQDLLIVADQNNKIATIGNAYSESPNWGERAKHELKKLHLASDVKQLQHVAKDAAYVAESFRDIRMSRVYGKGLIGTGIVLGGVATKKFYDSFKTPEAQPKAQVLAEPGDENTEETTNNGTQSESGS